MNCPTCGTLNEAGRKFCGECGTRLAVACPNCGTANNPGTKFCGECGTGLTDAVATPAAAPTPVAAAPEPIAERRLVTVLFGDLVGSTTLAEDRDPEETRNLLNRYFDSASEVIARYGGTVEKFIGDAVMAVWGVPIAHEDDAERAVRAALDLLDAVRRVTDQGQPLQMRAAVLTGEAAATIGAAGQGIVAGDLVNTASRLQGVAPPGTVLVGEATKRATAEAIAYEEAGDQLLKGKTAPVAAWRAVQVLGMRGGAGRRSALEPPFVGRDEELRFIKDLFHATVRESKPRLVTIIGQAGIGKSRLGWEFEKYIDGVTQTVYWHAGRSPSYGEGISFWALAEMVRERADIVEGDLSDGARAKLSATCAEWLTDVEERRWVEPRLAGLLGLQEMPAGQREELFAAWRTFFQRIADRGPVILVFKDLHWADAGMLEFIEHLLTWSKSHPIFVLAMTRPDLLERHPNWGSGVRNATTVSLEPLPDAAIAQLLHGLVPGLPDSAVAAIIARAEGIPLYAVETVRMLIDQGQVVADGDTYVLAGSLDKLAVPETLHALVAARIDANEPADRALLADAAVLGQSFTTTALAGLTGGSADSLMPGLDRLVRRELLIRDDDPRSPERGQHRFVQAVVREVAYDTLSKADRRAKHLAAARYFESLGDEELTGVLANHYLEALHATPAGPEADALAAQARIALRAAADRANALHAWSVAYRHLTDALEVTTDPAELAATHLALANAGNLLVLSDEASTHALQAAEMADDLGDRGTANRARALAGQIAINRGIGADALAILEPAVAQLAESDPGADEVLSELARIYMLFDRNEESVDTAQRALRAAAPDRNTNVIVNGLVTQASATTGLGRVDEAEAIMRGAIVLADRNGHIAAALRARNNLTATIGNQAPVAEMLPILNEAVDLALRFGMSGWSAQLVLSRVGSAFLLGEFDIVRSDLDLLADWTLSEFHEAMFVTSRALMAATEGRDADAEAGIAEAQRLLGSIDTAPQVTSVALTLSMVRMCLGDPRRALAALDGVGGGGNDMSIAQYGNLAAGLLGDEPAAAAFRAKLEGEPPVAWVEVIRRQVDATGAAIAGRWDEARAAYLHALAGFQRLTSLFEGSLLALEFAAYLGERDPEARAAGEAAAAWFAERGAGVVVERYRAAFRGTPAPPSAKAAAKPKAERSVEIS